MLHSLKGILDIQELDMKMIRLMRLKRERSKELEHIDSLRQGMRQRMRESALMREEAFTRSLETLYRDTWREWCEKRR